jgi:type I restriction-modification system DNA methylase subunit
MTDLNHVTFLSKAFLRSQWEAEYQAWCGSEREKALEERLSAWAKRLVLKETSAESALISVFFRDTWGYAESGQMGGDSDFNLYPKFSISLAGVGGGRGEADLAIGYFASPTNNYPFPKTHVPQILCEFKDIKIILDVEQKRKGNTRSPVRQCLDYLSFARRGMTGSEPVIPTWGIVTDMNEFRLYWYEKGHQQFLRFVIEPKDLLQGEGLLRQTESARFERFLFEKIFHRDTLLTKGGKSLLVSLIHQQRFNDRKLEQEFYAEYRAFREKLYLTLLEHNGEGTGRFPQTRGRLVRLAQKILDRFIFIFFCEDMGRALAFPPQLLRDFLIHRSNERYFDPKKITIWQEMLDLFKAMDTGDTLWEHKINQFNGGLFAPDPELEALHIPNSIFCQHMQGQNEASLYTYKQTLLYLSASYNYAADLSKNTSPAPFKDGEAVHRPSKTLGLYTLGHIFEQSITELEILEAEAEGRPSLNKEGKRKRDGVYYTPEWVVERIVEETVGARLKDIQRECGWPENDKPSVEAIDAFIERLKTFTVLDPACGSGAFLITTLRYLLEAWRNVRELRKDVSGTYMAHDHDALIRDLLKDNIYGVDINASSVEIARLALWLHTARGDKPLSSLENTIREGNSLIDSTFYKGQINLSLYDANEKERINAFDWKVAFPHVFKRGGFDAVVGNPPYVKLQNFRKVHADMALFLREGRKELDIRGYESAQTGNFDLYLPFIEQGLNLLNHHGRLGYIAPSLWTVNEYGEGLRTLMTQTHSLEKWIDFKAYQVFEEATTYTSLQFFTKQANAQVKIAFAPKGVIEEKPWDGSDCALAYERLAFSERWLMVTGQERELIERLSRTCKRLDDLSITHSISQGIISGAFKIFAFKRKTKNTFYNEKFLDLGEYKIENEILLDLCTGGDIKRYQDPIPSLCIIFPYLSENGEKYVPINEEYFLKKFPNSYNYLSKFKNALLDRDGIKEGTEEWMHYSRNQNLSKQNKQKILIAGTATEIRASIDNFGKVAANDKRVYTVINNNNTDIYYLLSILNSKVVSFVFKSIARPKLHGFYDIEEQFIAPLPIPHATPHQQKELGVRAKDLQVTHTRKRDVIALLARRMEGALRKSKPLTWLFPILRPLSDWKEHAPKNLKASDSRKWAKEHYDTEVALHYENIQSRLQVGATLEAAYTDGELRFLIDDVCVIDRVFIDEKDALFYLAQWKVVASTFKISENTKAEKLCKELCKIALNDDSPIVAQVIKLQEELSDLEQSIAIKERDVNAVIYDLYNLTPEDIALIERG